MTAPLHNALRRAPWIPKALRRLVGLGQDDEGLERVGETLTPIVDMWALPDAAFLRDERLCGFVVTVGAGGAGTNTYLALSNQSDDLLIVVERAAADTAAFFGAQANTAPPITTLLDIGAGTPRDTRWRLGTGMVVGRGRILRGTLAAIPPPTLSANYQRQLANISFDVPVVVGPGASFVIEATAQNVGFTGWINYRERVLLPEERGRFGVGT